MIYEKGVDGPVVGEGQRVFCLSRGSRAHRLIGTVSSCFRAKQFRALMKR
jgi:hypothetical protein